MKKTNILIIVLTIISVISLGLSIYNFTLNTGNSNFEKQVIGKWKNTERVCDDNGCNEVEVIYEFKKDGTCKINDYDCTYRNGFIDVSDDLSGEYHISINNDNKMFITIGLQHIAHPTIMKDNYILEKID